MPGRDKAGLDGSNWRILDPHTAIAQRRETTTGVEARSRDKRTYLEVTSPRIESKTKETKPTDLGVLTPIHTGEGNKEYLSRLASYAQPKEKMMKEEETIVGKADASTNNTKPEKLDAVLRHVLTNVSNLDLKGRHWIFEAIFLSNRIFDWEDFELYEDKINQLADLTYTDKKGKKIDFKIHDVGRLRKLLKFMSHARDNSGISEPIE